MGSICHFPRALPASIWRHCSQILVFTSTRGTQKRGVAMTFFVLFFPASAHLGTPIYCRTKENAKWQIDRVLPPHQYMGKMGFTNRVFLNLWFAKKPLTRVSKRVIEAHGKRSLERGWQKRLAKGWRKVGTILAKGWQRVGKVAGVLRGNTIRGNTTRNSERKMALWEGLWEVLWQTSQNLWKPLKTSKNLWKPLKTSQNLWKPLKPSLSEILSETLSEADFPLRTSQSCCP